VIARPSVALADVPAIIGSYAKRRVQRGDAEIKYKIVMTCHIAVHAR